MVEWIIKSNEWYDKLPELKRAIFFFLVILGPILVAQYISMKIAFPITIFVFWRISYVIIQWRKEFGKLKNKNR